MQLTEHPLENILCCPITKERLIKLSLSSRSKLAKICFRDGLFYHDGTKVTELPAAIWQTENHAIYYPEHQDIVCLKPELAMFTEESSDLAPAYKSNASILKIKQQMQNFYDDVGWSSDNNHYKDAIDSEDLRAVSRSYINRCHQRVVKFLPKAGKFLLDCACGPIQYPEYLAYSANYEYRVCADLSFRALVLAKEKLGSRGLYVLCDITNLPFIENTMDAVVSLHTVYHVPKQEQAIAISEIYRVLQPSGKSVIVYSWGRRSLLMNLFLAPLKVFRLIKKLTNVITKFLPGAKQNSIYFYTHSYPWAKANIINKYSAKMYCWRAVNVEFLKIFIHKLLFGRAILELVYKLESKLPKVFARFGAYPMFVIEKPKQEHAK